MPNRSLFQSRSPLETPSRRWLVLKIQVREIQRLTRRATLCLVSTLIFVGLLLSLKTLLSPRSLDLATLPHVKGLATKAARDGQRKPPVLRPNPDPHGRRSSISFLPNPDSLDINARLVNFHQYSFSRNTDLVDITAILPINQQSLSWLRPNLGSLISTRSSLLKEIIILCHSRIVYKVEHAVKIAQATLKTSILVKVLSLSQPRNQDLSILHALSHISTPRVLLLGPNGLRDVDDTTRIILLDSVSSAVPVGPYGFLISSMNATCATALERVVPVAYLIPPFLSPTPLLIQAENGMQLDIDTWAALGERIVGISNAGLGGLAMSSKSLSQNWCAEATSVNIGNSESFFETFYRQLEQSEGVVEPSMPLNINILLPSRQDLEAFGSTACKMARRGSVLRIMLYSWSHPESYIHFALNVGCHIHFETIARTSMNALINELKTWVQEENGDSVWIYASHLLTHTLAIETSIEPLRLAGKTIIVPLQLEDLPYCEWMSLLGVSEWQNWSKPKIDLSVITNDRPQSLARLLASLTAARYYGDKVQLKINLEQTADSQTRQQIARFQWSSGTLHIHHRVIAAGVLPAVTEAWYPHDNDSYGVLLEDDVEISPMFYAWIKMAILRYRYGLPHNRAPSLFGISLYQPTNLELRVEGRIPFNPRITFAEQGLSVSRTPYLSQVPCSWGAVYFPEHFVEFHDYLALRLSEVSHNISEVIIPDIRSNRWTKSWKKYFNELVYLRGYVMLYPNYDLSLATNHLEVGAHVTSDPSDGQDSLRRQFEVPLMPLPSPKSPATYKVRAVASLLDLPAGSLPNWDDLPVLDLWGMVTSHREIVNRGRERHEKISGCTSLSYSTQFHYDASQLLCQRLVD